MSYRSERKTWNRLLWALIFMFILMSMPSMSASPPFIENNQQFTSGYVIKYPSDQVIKQGSDYEFEAHVFNISNGVPVISGISCNFHLYNSSGKHILEMFDNTVSHTYDYTFEVSGSNFTAVGDYYYIIQCNSSSYGGFIEVPIEITPNGLIITEGRSFIDVGLLFLLVAFFFGTMLLFIYYDNILTRVGTVGFGYLLLIAITFVAWNMANDFLLSSPFISDMFRIMFFVLIIGFFPLFLGSLAWYFIMITKIKEIQRLMDKGLSMDEAERRTGRKYK